MPLFLCKVEPVFCLDHINRIDMGQNVGHKSDLFNLSHSGIDQNMQGSVPDLDVSKPLCMVPDSNMNFSRNQK